MLLQRYDHSQIISLISISLCLLMTVGACSEEESVATPEPTPEPLATVCVDVTPDSTIFAWDLSGPGDYSLAGSGDTVLVEMPAGDYELSWETIEDYYTPDPPSEILSADGDTIIFTGQYTLIPDPTGPARVLFLGSSYFAYNDLPGMFEDLAEAEDKEVLVEAVIPLGVFLDYHTTSSTTISMINSRDWDFVILQGVGRIVAYPESAHFNLVSALNSLEQTIHNNCSATEIMFCMPWAFEDGMLWTAGGTDDYFDMQQLVYDNTLTYPDLVDIVISPVGWAWNSIMLEQPPEHYLFMSDWNHPSLRGSYLTACAIYSSVFRESVESSSYLAGLPEDEANHFQSVASGIVMDNLGLWRLNQ